MSRTHAHMDKVRREQRAAITERFQGVEFTVKDVALLLNRTESSAITVLKGMVDDSLVTCRSADRCNLYRLTGRKSLVSMPLVSLDNGVPLGRYYP